MNTLKLAGILQNNKLRVFTTADAISLSGLSNSALVHTLTRMAKAGLVVHLKRNIWVNKMIENFRIEEAVPYTTSPWVSYVSLYSALSEFGFIDEVPQFVTVVTGARAFSLKTPFGDISVHHIPSENLFGFYLKVSGTGRFPIADPEKALLDLVYLSSVPRSGFKLPVFRTKPKFDIVKLKKYASRWKHPAIREFIQHFCSRTTPILRVPGGYPEPALI